MENFEKFCYQTNDLMADAIKWKKIATNASNETERSLAKEIADGLHEKYKKANEVLVKMFME